mmetsp:Transcript_27373/g.59816  ORF Transcript_27373/g.59816 Transcript_27373/m.59816 type:complete len:128 (+) Transcript_27373:1067-1450(+)
MDAEHQECVELINALAEHRSRAALEAVLSEFLGHFQHEEAMLEECGFGGGGGQFSALESHKKEHQRILRMLEHQLAELPAGGADTDAPDGPKVVSAAFVRQVISDFVEHAEHYDSKYTTHVLQAMAA